jgi:DNA-binding XRE family transcriptional regulator
MKREVLLKKVGKQVTALREKAGISQSELARLCQKDRQSIHAFEKGEYNASLVYLMEIAKALNVKLSELVDIE